MSATEEASLAAVRLDLLRILYEKGHHNVTIRLSDGTELQHDRNILCSQSDFFKKALDPGRFEESFTGVVELPNDPPEAVKAWIQFLYTQDYTFPTDLGSKDAALFHLDVMEVADVYLDFSLGYEAYEKVKDLILLDWDSIIPVIPDLLNIRDWAFSVQEEVEEAARASIQAEQLALVEESVWAKLHEEAPEFMNDMRRYCWDSWIEWGCAGSGKWLDRLGEDYSVELEYRKLKCPHCGLVATRAVGLAVHGGFYCSEPGCGYSLIAYKWKLGDLEQE